MAAASIKVKDSIVRDAFSFIRKSHPEFRSQDLTIEWSQPAAKESPEGTSSSAGTQEFNKMFLEPDEIDIFRIHSCGVFRHSGPTENPDPVGALKSVASGHYEYHTHRKPHPSQNPVDRAVLFPHVDSFEKEERLFAYGLSKIARRSDDNPIIPSQVFFEDRKNLGFKVAHCDDARLLFWYDFGVRLDLQDVKVNPLDSFCTNVVMQLASDPYTNFSKMDPKTKQAFNHKLMAAIGVTRLCFHADQIQEMLDAMVVLASERRVAVEITPRLPDEFIAGGRRVFKPKVGAMGLNADGVPIFSPRFPAIMVHPMYDVGYEEHRDRLDEEAAVARRLAMDQRRMAKAQEKLPEFLKPRAS